VLGDKTGELASDIYDTIEEMTTRAGGISCTPEDLSKKPKLPWSGLKLSSSGIPILFSLRITTVN